MKILQLLFLVLFLNISIPLSIFAQNVLPDTLPKTKDLNNKDKEVVKENSTSQVGSEETEEEEEKEKIEPSSIFKLVAVFIIEKQPRALIKNLTKPEEPAREFQVGDYLDDEQIYTLSRITFNPTTRIEIIDQSGLSYLVKQSVIDEKVQKAIDTVGSGTGRSLPSKFTSSKTIKKKTPKIETSQPQEKKEEVKETIEAQVKKEEVKDITDAQAKKEEPAEEAKQKAETPATQGGQTSQGVTIGGGQSLGKTEKTEKKPDSSTATTPSQSSDALGVSRPTDAYGNK